MNTLSLPSQARSGTAQENIQEVLDAEGSAKALNTGQQQYCTPQWLAEQCQRRFPRVPASLLDPQCGEAALLYGTKDSWPCRYGIDIDNRIEDVYRASQVKLITGNCVKAVEILDELYPEIVFECGNANPPFGKSWKMADGSTMDSTYWTWKFITRRCNWGYFIANDVTLKKLLINQHPWVFNYETHDGNSIWGGMRDTLKIGIAFWRAPHPRIATNAHQINQAWKTVGEVLEQERRDRPPFNIWLDRDGTLRTYLSIRQAVKMEKGGKM